METKRTPVKDLPVKNAEDVMGAKSTTNWGSSTLKRGTDIDQSLWSWRLIL